MCKHNLIDVFEQKVRDKTETSAIMDPDCMRLADGVASVLPI